MKKEHFLEVLNQYSVSPQGVYQDLSEIGKVLWHNSFLALKIVASSQSEPMISIVTLHATGYAFFQTPIKNVSLNDFLLLQREVETNSTSIHALAEHATKELKIAILEKHDLIFNRTP